MALNIITVIVSYHVHFIVWNRTHIWPVFLEHTYRKANTKLSVEKERNREKKESELQSSSEQL